MKFPALLFFVLGAAGLAGCAHTYADLSTLQDAKYPVAHTAKIAVAEVKDSTTVDLATRLAGEVILQQLSALGWNLAPPDQADFELGFKVSEKDVPTTFGVTMPTISNTYGDVNGRPIMGTTFGDVVVPQTRNVNTTELAMTLQRLQEPKVIVWQGRILAPTSDARQYQAQFYRALLAHLGETTEGDAQLDGNNNIPAK